MTTTKYFLLTLLTAMFIFCGSDKTDESFKVIKRSEKIPLSDIKAPQNNEKILKITEVKFGPLIDADNNLTATPILSDRDSSEEFTFRWFVNDVEIEGITEDVLSREYFKEDDWVYCRVKITDQDETFPEYTSKRVRINGSLPILIKSESGSFTFPGIFKYKINAKMPEIEDFEPEYGDEDEFDPEKSIKFGLISPLDKGIELNTQTGEITWNLTKDLIEELGEKITIKFSISSPSGRQINSSVTINLTKVEKEDKSSDNNSTLGNEIE